jgi:uncharacterized protein YndB with AHSA1/START domain
VTTVRSPLGEIQQESDGTRTLVFRRRYPDPIDEVWSAITESDRLARWLGSYEGDPSADRTVLLTMTSQEDAGGEPATVNLVECRPPERLVVDISEANQEVWRIAVTLATEVDATTLLFQQSVPPEMDPADVACGWHWYLDRLAASLTGAPMPAWTDYYPGLVSAYRDGR